MKRKNNSVTTQIHIFRHRVGPKEILRQLLRGSIIKYLLVSDSKEDLALSLVGFV